MADKKVLLSIQDLVVKFKVRGRSLTAIRGISLDIYENESIAIVGESGSGKSVFTKTFANMLDSNGYVDNGKIIYDDPSLAETVVKLGSREFSLISKVESKLNEYSKLENGAEVYNQIEALKAEHDAKMSLTPEEEEEIAGNLSNLRFERAETFNHKQTLDPDKEKEEIKADSARIDELDKAIKEVEQKKANILKERKAAFKADTAYQKQYESKLSELKEKYKELIGKTVPADKLERNKHLAKEVCLSIDRFDVFRRMKVLKKLEKLFKDAMTRGIDLTDDEILNDVYAPATFRVKLTDETPERLHGYSILDLANVTFSGDLSQIRGKRIATVFQDPMTSLNPTITIGKQISSIIIKHQGCSEAEARTKALEMMVKVGIPNPEMRYNDYPFQYSGGMRQRIVIAIALSCQPQILICDEPTTALDVTIQAQILKLIKDLQKEFNYTIVFITHDLGVVANIADRVAVMYAGQIVELGTVEDVFYDPRHPYTWALLSSLPQLAERNTTLYSISGTPPSLYNTIIGDPFAPRNPYCMKIDTLIDPPMFKVSDTHYAKTWLLDPRSPHVEKPEIIHNMHEKLLKSFNI